VFVIIWPSADGIEMSSYPSVICAPIDTAECVLTRHGACPDDIEVSATAARNAVCVQPNTFSETERKDKEMIGVKRKKGSDTGVRVYAMRGGA
jgi:hypothetical protein